MLEKEIEDQILTKNTLIAIINEEGEINWIISGQPTLKQKIQFQKIYIVTDRPSLVLQVFIFIEIRMLKLVNFFEKLFTKENKKNE